ncbi:MAG: ABC transporter permease [Polyangiales bacterium]
MGRAADALAPNRAERLVRSAGVIYVLFLVALPLCALAWFGLSDGLHALANVARSNVARAAIWLTLWTSTLVGVLDVVLGTITAWVLVRYDVPGKSLVSALIDLPFAIPTLVTGVMLALLYGPTSLLGHELVALGLPIIFAPPGIVLALLFVTLPFVVRAVEPVLTEIDESEEEAALILGASPLQAFVAVYLPAIGKPAISAGIRALARALAEFGSVVVVAGNMPLRTLTAPVFVLGEIESGTPRTAAAMSVVLLGVALLLHATAHTIERRVGAQDGA